MEKPLITIIIASFNSGTTISEALQSVSNLSFSCWECLVIDGGSTDNTISIIQKYRDRDSRFRYISEPDEGIYDAFNKGWKNANGEWIYYCGSDDKLMHDGLEKLKEYIDTECAVISGHVLKKQIDGKETIWYSKGFGGCHQGKITRKSVLENMNGYNTEYRILADLDFYIRLRNKGYKVRNIPEVIASFDAGGASHNLKNLPRRTCERYYIYKRNGEKYPVLNAVRLSIMEFLRIIYRKISKNLN